VSTPRTGAYLISKGELAPGWLMLYAITLALQLPCAFVRGMVTYSVLWVGLKIVGQTTGPLDAVVSVVAYGPLVLSLATLILPLGGWWWEQQAGGRAPSVRAMWGVYWRAREHYADHYAASLGQATGLSEFLDTCALENDLPVPFVWLTEHTHPPTEHRIDRLSHHPP
jgi:Peptidase family M48